MRRNHTHSKSIFAAASAVVLGLATLTGCSQPGPDIAIIDPWVRASEYSATAGGMTGMFLEIENNSGETITLVGATTDAAAIVEIHEMAMVDSEMVMQKLEGGLEIPAGQTAVLEMGGNHIMLMGLNASIEAGDKISITLDFEGTDDVILTDVVAKPADGGDEPYHSESEMDH